MAELWKTSHRIVGWGLLLALTACGAGKSRDEISAPRTAGAEHETNDERRTNGDDADEAEDPRDPRDVVPPLPIAPP